MSAVVGTTLGPGGRHVALQRQKDIAVTKDGATVAREVELRDPVGNVAAKIIREAAERTARPPPWSWPTLSCGRARRW
jgi:chaperonin GroEL